MKRRKKETNKQANKKEMLRQARIRNGREGVKKKRLINIIKPN
jgi:hypothetical protein